MKNTVDTVWKILVIDDDEDDILIVREKLKEAKGRKYDVDWATTYDSGRKALFSGTYNAVLVDYDLGTHTGIDLIREANKRGCAAPLILFTGRGSYEVDLEAMAAGATLYLTKGEANALLLERGIRIAIEMKEKELALRFSDERFEKAFNANPNAQVISHQADGRIEVINNSFEQLFGYQRAEVIGKTSLEMNMFVNPADRETALRRLKAEEILRDFELEIRTKSGEIRQASLSIELIAVGSERLMLTVITDITERRRVEAALGESERRYDTLFNAKTNGIAHCRVITDAQGQPVDYEILHINDAYETITGIKRAEIEGRRAREVFPGIENFSFNYIGKYGEVGLHGGELNFETFFEATQQWLSIYIYSPKQGEFTAIFSDISQRKQAEQALVDSEYQHHESTEALRESEALLETFFANSPGILNILDEDFRYIKTGRVTPAYFGLTRQTIVGRSASELIPDFGTQLAPSLKKTLETGQSQVNIEVQIPMPGRTGENACWLVSCFPVTVTGGKSGIGIMGVEITHQKNAEKLLRESESKMKAHARELEAIFEAMPAYMWITHDQQAREMTGNQQAFDLARMKPGENVSKTGPEPKRLHHFKFMRDGREIPNEDLPVQRVAASGVPIRNCELDLVFEDGEIRHLIGNVSPLLDESGKPAGAVSAFIDVTPVKIYQRKLQESENRFRVALASAPITVFTTDTNLRITWMYDPLPGFQVEQVLGLRLDEMTPTDYGKTLSAIQQTVISSGQPRQGEIETIAYDRPAYFAYSIDPIRDESGTVTGLACAGYDITDRKVAEKNLERYAEELERSNQALSEFAFIASHDLQEPLRKIIGFSNSLQRHSAEILDPEARDYLDRMQNAAERMQLMINGLLDLSRVNTRSVTFTPIDLNQLAQEVVSDLETRIRAVNGQVTIDDLPTIEADELQMRQLIQNLIGNAIKFHKPDTPPMVHVSGRIRHTDKNPTVEIRVEDNGIGFEQEHAKRIFQPFQRLHGRNAYEGTGLGLAICQKIVERHHGSIEVQSTPDQGSTFFVLLPYNAA